MIRITVRHNASRITGFSVIGHAGSGRYGHDIVCAAVSVLSISTLNGIIRLAGIRPQIQQDTVRGGLLVAKIFPVRDSLRNLKAQVLLRNFELGIQSIAQRYARYVNVRIIK